MAEIKSRQRTFSYDFVKHGTKVVIDQAANEFLIEKDRVSVRYDRASTVILDVGNCLAPGVIDAHHLKDGFLWKNSKIGSTAKLLSCFPSYLKHIKEHIEHVTIVVHSYPDFDCIVAAYLTRYYLQHREFPLFTEELTEYAECIDAGRLKVSPSQLFTPYSIALVLGEGEGEDDQSSLQRGFELLDYIFKRLPELSESERAIDSPVLFEENHPFQFEQQLIEADYRKYQRDLEMICEKRTLRLPAFDGSMKEVDGLFWEKEPTSLLNRLWARCDSTSPSGTGYVFTFVPIEIQSPESIIDLFMAFPLIQEELRNTSRVIISVDGNSEVTLLDLGKALELEEQKKESRILGKLKEKWRTRNPELRRFLDDWADNADPWYDGRRDRNQIVDSPRVGSLLTVKEIKDAVLEYTKPKVKENKTRLLFPFQFRTTDFTKLFQHFLKNPNFHQQDLTSDDETAPYFHPYIREYLSQGKKKAPLYSSFFEGDQRFYLRLSLTNNKVSSGRVIVSDSELGEGVEGRDVKDEHVYIDVGKISLALFRYGAGFIIVDTAIRSNSHESIPLDALLEMNRELCEGMFGKSLILEYADRFLPDLKSFLLGNIGDAILYSEETLDQSSYFDSVKKELIYKLCTQSQWNTKFTAGINDMTSMLDRMLYEKNDFMSQGFSKKGSILLSIEKDTSKFTAQQRQELEQETEEQRNFYQTRDYLIFLLVLHQRYVLLNFSIELAEIGVRNNPKRISKLRDDMFEFMTQGWFSQITDDGEGLIIYRKWAGVFETQLIYEEVMQQISTIADYQSAKMEKAFNLRFTLFSFIFLIITGITGFFGMNIPVIGTFTDENAVVFSIYSSLSIIALWYFVLWIGKGRK